MNRRLFLTSFFVSAAGMASSLSVSRKELVVDYGCKDPSLFRTVIVTDELSPNKLGVVDQLDGQVMLLDANRAWLLSDGRLEVERYVLEKDFCCPIDSSGKMLMITTILDRWTVRTLNFMGYTISERKRKNIS